MTTAVFLDASEHDTTGTGRRGLVRLVFGGLHWASRHTGPHAARLATPVCVFDTSSGQPQHRCRCKAGRYQCCEHTTAADRLCEACRRWCPVPRR
ncbi:hypothetical protein [Parafrankia soli]|uniref:hypothetical protein n=1 Tax=Parafrankia soli TaxID=2599596 RepID=UPI001041C5CD|nr:hypothetical protein [Parafrankia soli]